MLGLILRKMKFGKPKSESEFLLMFKDNIKMKKVTNFKDTFRGLPSRLSKATHLTCFLVIFCLYSLPREAVDESKCCFSSHPGSTQCEEAEVEKRGSVCLWADE